MITIKEMANMLGISSTTVSNVIHGKTSEVSQSTVEKVKKLLEEYDYVPNINARNLASNCSKIIGVAMVNLRKGFNNYLQDAFVSELVGSIERAFKSSGYYMMMYFTQSTEELMQTVFSWNVDGLILFGIVKEDYIEIKKKFKKPLVFIDSYIDNFSHDVVNIGLDDKISGYVMGKYLIEKGHSSIAFLSDNFLGSDYERYCGFASAMSEYKIGVGPENYIRIDSETNLEKSMEEICRLSSNYTAFFCASDFYALMILNSLRDHGISVPDDISIVGFDDNIYSQLCRPAITTMHQNPSKKGELAVKYLIDQLEGKKIEENWVILPTKLIERDTVKDLSNH